MSDNFKFVQAQAFALSGAGAVAGATSITLKSFAQINGTLLTLTDFGTKGYLTMEPGNGTLEEQISFTGVTQNSNGTATLTGVSTVIMVSPYTETSGLAQTHAGSTSVIISNTAGFYNSLTGKADDETITGTWTFTNPNYPRMDTSTPFPTDNEQLATKAYADSLTFAGAPNATTTQKGIVELATQAEVDARTATGGTGASLVPTPALARSVLMHDSVTSAVGTDSYAITLTPAVTSYTEGDIYIFKADVANTGTCSLAVNGLSAITLKVNGLVPRSNYITAGATVICRYNATGPVMDVLSISGGQPQVSVDGVEIYAADAGANDTYVITLTPAISAYTVGQVFRFKANTANTGAASINVNSVGALSILRWDGSALANSDIAAGQIVEVVVFDGSNVRLLSPVGPQFSNGTTTKNIADADTTQTIAHGLGRAPRKVRLIGVIGSNTLTSSSNGQFDASGQNGVAFIGIFAGSGTSESLSGSTIRMYLSPTQYNTGTVSVDATNISIAWVKTSTATGTAQILWTAEA